MGWIGLTALVLAGAQGAPALKPTAKWKVEYNENDCTMSRSFGDPAGPVTFGFQPSPTGSLGEVALLMPANGHKNVRRGKGAIVLHPSGERFEARYAIGTMAGGRRGGRFDVDQDFWDALPGATSLTTEFGGEAPFTIGLGSMKGPLAAIKTCTDDLLRSWGAEPGAIARWPRNASPAKLFSDNYPPGAIRADEQGRTVPLVTVDRAGKPVSCRTVKTQASPTLDRATCDILMRYARFEPADPDGPERRFAVVPVRWVLPL